MIKNRDNKKLKFEKSVRNEEFYLKEIERLNEVIEIKEEQLLLTKSQMEVQEKLMNMVVHDMRNPSEAISNGLS